MKTVWLLGNFESDLEQEMTRKGYLVKNFPSGKPGSMVSDDHPDMIFFSDLTPENADLFIKINEFFPGSVVVSIPQPSADKRAEEERLNQAMSRLIRNLRNNESIL